MLPPTSNGSFVTHPPLLNAKKLRLHTYLARQEALPLFFPAHCRLDAPRRGVLLIRVQVVRAEPLLQNPSGLAQIDRPRNKLVNLILACKRL